MRVTGTCHCYRATHVADTVARFVGDRRIVFLEVEPGRVAARLDHESRDDAVKYESVVKAAVDKAEEMPDRKWCGLASNCR